MKVTEGKSIEDVRLVDLNLGDLISSFNQKFDEIKAGLKHSALPPWADPDHLDANQATKVYFKVYTPQSIRNMANRNQIPSHRDEKGNIYFKESELKEHMEKQMPKL